MSQKQKTWGTLKAEILRETNTEDEYFVNSEELLAWANDAISEAEAEIVGLYDKYLETRATLPLVSGQSDYDLPCDIYANKITGIFYQNNNRYYEIRYLKKKEDTLYLDSYAGEYYRYRIMNNSTGKKITLFPPSKENSTSNVTIWYIREAEPVVSDSDMIDLPIADHFIKQYVKDKIKSKEFGPGGMRWPTPELEKQRELFIEALNRMIPDDSSDEIESDYDSYECHYQTMEYDT